MKRFDNKVLSGSIFCIIFAFSKNGAGQMWAG